MEPMVGVELLASGTVELFLVSRNGTSPVTGPVGGGPAGVGPAVIKLHFMINFGQFQYRLSGGQMTQLILFLPGVVGRVPIVSPPPMRTGSSPPIRTGSSPPVGPVPVGGGPVGGGPDGSGTGLDSCGPVPVGGGRVGSVPVGVGPAEM